jgi:hypothetical protein
VALKKLASLPVSGPSTLYICFRRIYDTFFLLTFCTSEASPRYLAYPGDNPPRNWRYLGGGGVEFEPGTAALQFGALPPKATSTPVHTYHTHWFHVLLNILCHISWNILAILHKWFTNQLFCQICEIRQRVADAVAGPRVWNILWRSCKGYLGNFLIYLQMGGTKIILETSFQ